jgi:hypothetical protein
MVPIYGCDRTSIIVKINPEQPGNIGEPFASEVQKKRVMFVTTKGISLRDETIQGSKIPNVAGCRRRLEAFLGALWRDPPPKEHSQIVFLGL